LLLLIRLLNLKRERSKTMDSKARLKINDISKDTEKLTSVAVDDLMPLPADFEETDWGEIPESTR